MYGIVSKLKLLFVALGFLKFSSLFDSPFWLYYKYLSHDKAREVVWTCVVFLLKLDKGQVFIFFYSCFTFFSTQFTSPLPAFM